jgi:hypothetical protein
MFYATLLKKITGYDCVPRGTKNVTSRRRQSGSQLRVEPLEDRRMLSVSSLLATALGHAAAPHVTPSATVTATLEDHPSASSYGQRTSLVAKITGATGGTVEFFDGTTVLGTATPSSRGVATFVTTSLPIGPDSLLVEYFSGTDTTVAPVATSAPVVDNVTAAHTYMVVTASGNPGVAGTNVSFTAVVSSRYSVADSGGLISPPAGTVAFTVTNKADGTVVATDSGVPLDSAGTATFTPSPALATGTYVVTAVFTSTDTNYQGSTSGKLTEKIVEPATVGVGSVLADSVTLRGGIQFTSSLAQTLDSSTNALVESGQIHYVDTAHGIDLTADASLGQITSVVFNAQGQLAEISGVGTNVDPTTHASTLVNFTLVVNGAGGHRFLPSGVDIFIAGTGIDYHKVAALTSGSISVTGSDSSTTLRPPLSLPHDHALEAVVDDLKDVWSTGWGKRW